MKTFAGLVLVTASIVATPVTAQTMTTDEQDAYYESCMHEYVSRHVGDENHASAFCYPRAYGNESAGGGGSTSYSGYETRECYGSYGDDYCDRGVVPK